MGLEVGLGVGLAAGLSVATCRVGCSDGVEDSMVTLSRVGELVTGLSTIVALEGNGDTINVGGRVGADEALEVPPLVLTD